MRKQEEIFKVPEGYFSSLEMKLSMVPSRADAVKGRPESDVMSRKRHLLPAISLCAAACVCAAVVLGVHFRREAGFEKVLDVYEHLYYADLIPLTDPDMIFDMTEVEPACSSEDIEDYLIDTGVSFYMIEQTLN